MICSEDEDLEDRIKEYTRYLVTSGWSWKKAYKELRKGASKPRSVTLEEKRKTGRKKTKKIAWVTTYDPRTPSKSKIIRNNLAILYNNPNNKTRFPPNHSSLPIEDVKI